MAPSNWTAAARRLLARVGVATPEPFPCPGLDTLAVSDPDRWLARRVARSRDEGVWEQALERIVRNQAGRAPEAILFLHGFGATRAEGEAVVGPLALSRGANVYYARLPGHGMTMDDQARVTPADYQHAAAEALGVACALGHTVTVVGSSTGALLAMWLAATYPHAVNALVLSSPFYAFAGPGAQLLLGTAAAPLLARLVFGEVRDATWSEDPRCVDGYNDHWLVYQRPQALVALERLRHLTARTETFKAVVAPVLQLTYFKNDAEQDSVVSVAAADAAYALYNAGTPHPLSRSVRIENGAHILLSAWVHSDKAAVLTAFENFFKDVFGPPPP